MVRCVIFDGYRAPSGSGDSSPRITHVHEGQVLAAWRAVEGKVGFALLNVSTMAMISSLLKDAFPDARHVDVDEVLAVETVAETTQQQTLPPSAGESRQTGT